MNFKFALLLPCAVAALSAVAVPTVSDVALGQNPANRNVRVDYTLSERAIVTWTLETNAVANAAEGWVAVPEGLTNTRTWGDVNRRVDKTGACTFYWAADHVWADQLVAEGKARAVVTAWPLSKPPLYMVVDMFGGPCIRYYTSEAALPDGGLANNIYRTHKLVMRKIPAKDVVWTMGVPADVGDGSYDVFTDANKANYEAHKVKLTYDYYLAIYELTRAQWGNAMQTTRGYGWMSTHMSFQNALPAGGEYPDGFRHGGWDSFCDRLRQYHGADYAFDLVSSAEWEYAYRAGEPKTLYTGKDWLPENIREVGNTYADDCAIHEVGVKYPPNRWGLYDMFGNAYDGVRDYGDNPLWWKDREDYKATGICVDPVKQTTGAGYNARGFSVAQWYQIQEGDGWAYEYGAVMDGYGYRIMCPIPNED